MTSSLLRPPPSAEAGDSRFVKLQRLAKSWAMASEEVVSDTIAKLMTLFASRGSRVWLLGSSARASLAIRASVEVDLLTDASTESIASVLADDLVSGASEPIYVASLGELSLPDRLATFGFSIDAIAIDLADGTVTDPHGGVAHLASGSIRTIAAPDTAFRDDPVLLLRFARLVSETGFVASSELRRLATRDAGNILDTRHRHAEWGGELNRLLAGAHIERALQLLLETRLLAFLMPEVAALVGFDKTCSVHHKDIWEHTKLVTQKSTPDPVVRWTALCHDIGKIWTRSVTKGGKVHFFRHEEHGALLFEGIAHRVGLAPALAKRVSYVIENHSRVNLYQDEWTDSAVRRLIRDTGGHLPDLIAFSKADFTTKREAKIAELKRQMTELEVRIERIVREDATPAPLSKGIGVAIMEHFGLRPSRLVGELKRLLEVAIDAGELPARGDDATYLAWFDGQPELLARVAAESTSTERPTPPGSVASSGTRAGIIEAAA